MLNGIMSSRYYLFSISNLLGAFGGGLILGKATDVITNPILHGGSILAFFIGSVLGLSLLQIIPKKSTPLITQTFSIGCGLVSLVMFFTYTLTSDNGILSGNYGIVFFILLTIRFSLWFFSRVKRASESSGKEQSIAWVEFGYYFGMVLGLALWNITGVAISLVSALILDVILQTCAGLLDIKGFLIKESKSDIAEHTRTPTTSINTTYEENNSDWCKKMAFSVVALTVGIQVIIFHFAHLAPSMQTTYMLAVFYSGVALSAFVCNKLKVFLTWDSNQLTSVNFQSNKTKYSLNILTLIFIMTALMLTIFLNVKNILTGQNFLFILTPVFLIAFLYELISLSLLDRIGYEENQSDTQSIIMKTYGMMGVCSAIGFWLLISFKSNYYFATCLLLSCSFAALIATYKRPSHEVANKKIAY